MKGDLWWYVARTGGFLAWALSAFSILWGLLITSRALGKRISGPRLLDLHRFIGGLSVIFVGVHIVGLGLQQDQEISFGFKELFVPMASSWHPGAVAYGIVAFYLLIAVELTSLLRRHISAKLWRSVHYGGFAVFLLGSIHALKIGRDVQNPLIWWPSAILCAAIVGLAVTRAMAAAQDTSASPADLELEIFGTEAAELYAPTAFTPSPAPIPKPDPLAQALATPALADDNRAALLERTRRSLERLDITAYPKPELPPELLTTRPVQPAPAAHADQDEVVLPTRPTTDIALRYARLRNPANPRAARPPSFQALIPPGANNQSGWGQPPAGWDAPAAEGALEAPAPPAVEPEPVPAIQAELFAPEAPVAAQAPVIEVPLFADLPVTESPAPMIEPVTVNLPDPQNRTAWEDQLAPAKSSLDWRTPAARSTDSNGHQPVAPADTYDTEVDRDFDGAPEPTLANTRNGLPSRTPQRLARSTQPARTPLDWKPQRLETVPAGGPPPPPTPDPVTGEVASEQYRVWLREWLAFAETYDG